MKRNQIKNLLISLLTTSLVLSPKIANAAINYKVNGGSSITTLSAFLDRFINVFLLEFMGIALFISLIIGGFMYLTAGDNVQKAETAKKTIKYALIGIILAALCYSLIVIAINTINKVF